MKPFTLIVPDNLADAAKAGAAAGYTLFKAAGTDLLDRMKERFDTPETVVNLAPLKDELAGMKNDAGTLTIGALTTLTQLAESGLLGKSHDALREAAAKTATPPIRNRGTVGGNLLQLTRCWYLRSKALGCLHGGDGRTCLAAEGENRYHSVMGYEDCVRVHPSNLAPALYVLGAQVSVYGAGKTRSLPIAELYPESPTAGNREHTLQKGEILTAVHVPPQPKGTATAYRESREKDSFDWATTAAAVRLKMAAGKIADADVCLGAVAPNPLPRRKAAALLVGKAPSDELFEKVAAKAFEGAAPLAQNRYKVQVGPAVLREALAAAAGIK